MPRSSSLVALVAASSYVVGAWLLLFPLGLADRTHLPGCACGDAALQVWFLELARVSLGHGQMLFHTSLIDYPSGINLADNVGFPLLGTLLAPVTALIGPVGTFVLLLRLGLVLSSLSAFLVLRRLVRSGLAAGVGGALYGFSPYMTHQAPVHLFLAFVPLPPIMLLIVAEEVSRSHSGAAFKRGMLLGVLVVVQYFISAEVLITTALMAVVTLAVFAAWEMARRRPPLTQMKALCRLMAGATTVAVPCLAYPAWYALFGPQRVVGPTQPVTLPGIDVLGSVLPADRYLLAGGILGWRGPTVPLLGDMAFLGVPLLILLVWVVVRFRNLIAVRTVAVLAVAAWLLALGPRLVVNGRVTRVPLPFALLTRIPILQDVIPARLTLYVDWAAAVLVAFAIAGLIENTRLVNRSTGVRAGTMTRRKAAAVASIGAAGIAAALAPVLPVSRISVAALGTVERFAGGSVSHHIPTGAVVLTVPYPAYPSDQAMLWQAEDSMRFSLVGGYALRPDPNPALNKTPLPSAPAAIAAIMGRPANSDISAGVLKAARHELLDFVARYDVTTIVVDTTESTPSATVADLLSRIFGAPLRSGPLDVWRLAAPNQATASA
jgi:hypothetical protein